MITIYNAKNNLKFDKKNIQIVSIDPGLRNLAIRVEKRENDEIKTIYFNRFDVSDNKKLTPLTFIKIITILEHINNIIYNSNIVIIERQMMINSTNVRIFQHLLTYFLIKFPKIIISDISPKLKNNYFNLGGLKYNEVKKLSIEKAKEILYHRNDRYGIELMNGKKLDDLADTVLQIEVWINTI
ncbi:MAG: hypothetical protein QW478_01525 [Candidatus Micrarchaeaceae archaeon]